MNQQQPSAQSSLNNPGSRCWLLCVLAMVLALSGCTGLPEGIKPVSDFELDRYLGTWYEIARIDNRFEKGLSQVTASYRLRDDGGVQVINRGYDRTTQQWQQADGKAYFVRNTNEGYLKVSFFGPFYASYAIFHLDHQNYSYSFVTGNNRDYLWLLARTPVVSDELKAQFLAHARKQGFDTEAIIFVDQSLHLTTTPHYYTSPLRPHTPANRDRQHALADRQACSAMPNHLS